MRKLVLGIVMLTATAALTAACGDDDDEEAADTTVAAANALSADLTGGASEVPMPGDPDGSGTASITLDETTGEVCYDIRVEQIAEPVAAHIHEGAAATAGKILITFDPAKIGQGESCLSNQPTDVVKQIIANPTGYYVNVHTGDFPGGAVRGQLAKA
jgi:CHRD domain-containing protein